MIIIAIDQTTLISCLAISREMESVHREIGANPDRWTRAREDLERAMAYSVTSDGPIDQTPALLRPQAG